ncbi:sex-determining region Y protein-like [Selaginella moellendorffii]|uniref:sex-determining region Y protein-like n=1 Tax=Selaginella moellendorffii TaxID=88036 RepID=UPI000D1C6C4F|nr:sex-determining region Y protein-like [Selaginella moellendorffii]|eukprot:XP_024528846.1 sex-determining region Y protein-like [Selaginella moellendorffii]
MAPSDDDEYGEYEKEKPAEQVKKTTDDVKNAVKDDGQNKGKSVRDKANDLKQQAGEIVGKGQGKLAPYFSTAKEKTEKLEAKKPAVQEEAKEMLDQAKHTVSKVVQQESKDVLEGVKRLAKDEKAFHDAAHKVAEKIHHGGAGESEGHQQEHSNYRQQEHSDVNEKNQQHHIPDFSDFSEMEEEDWSDEAEGSSHHPKQHLLNEHRAAHGHQHHPPHQPQKRKKSPLGYFKVGAKLAGKEKNKGTQDNHQGEQQQQQPQQQQEQHGGGVLGTVKSVFGQGSAGEKSLDTASNLAQKKLGQMRHVVDAQMDEAGNATAAEKKTQGVGLVQSFVCLCTCASSVHVSG